MSKRAPTIATPSVEVLRLGRIRRAVALARENASAEWLRRCEELDAAVRLATNSLAAGVDGYTEESVAQALDAYEAHVGVSS